MTIGPIGLDELVVRTREARDTRELLDLFNDEQFLHFASPRGPFASCDELQAWFEGIPCARKFEIVAVVKDRAVGFGGLYVLNEGLEHIGWIMLGVRSDFQRRGIGSTLLRMLDVSAHVFARLQRVQLTAFSDNKSAIRLYKKAGFSIEGRHRRYFRRGGDFFDALTMAKIFPDLAGWDRPASP
jgi:putative acetyltransferase